MNDLDAVRPGGTLVSGIVAVLEEGQRTRQQLCSELGVSRTTLGRALNELIEGNYVGLTYAAPSGRGRPVAYFALNNDVVWAIGIDISRTRGVALAVNRVGDVVAESRVDGTHRGWTEVLGELVRRLSEELHAVDGIIGCLSHIGVGIPLPILQGPPLDGRDADDCKPVPVTLLESTIHDRFDAPIMVDNTVRMAALGEARWGAGKNVGLQIYVRISGGIVACSVVDSEVTVGAHGIAGELGHVRVPGGESECHCGKTGCLETVASVPAILRLSGHRTIGDLRESVQSGDPAAVECVGRAADAVAFALSTAVLLLDPELLILSGEVPEHVPGFVDEVKRNLPSHLIPGLHDNLDAVPALLEEMGSARGAILAAERYLTAQRLKMEREERAALYARSREFGRED
nr:ROK family transcriptional regulator [Corynebacterium pygosceleis]